jgi:cytochrome c biogenesis protein CcmG, thiol:disulfide interchange protein DsbE
LFSFANRFIKAAVTRGFFVCCLLAVSCATQAQQGRWAASHRAAPPLTLKDMEGRDIDLADLRGRVVIVNFWATWCAPCVAEMPSLQELAERLGEKKVIVLGVNFHESIEKVRDFQAKHQVQFPLLRDPWHEASAAWKVNVLPSTFIIDAKGRLRYTVVGEVNWLDRAVAQRLMPLLKATAREPAGQGRAQVEADGNIASATR